MRESESKKRLAVLGAFGACQGSHQGPFVLCVCVRDPDCVHVGGPGVVPPLPPFYEKPDWGRTSVCGEACQIGILGLGERPPETERSWGGPRDSDKQFIMYLLLILATFPPMASPCPQLHFSPPSLLALASVEALPACSTLSAAPFLI